MVNRKPNVLARSLGDGVFGDMMMRYRRHLLARNLSSGTVRQRLLHIERLQAVAGDVTSLSTADLEEYLAQRRNTHSAEARRSMRNSFLSFYKWAHRESLVVSDPAVGLSPVRLPRQVARICDDRDIMRGLDTATLPEKAMVLLGRLGGLRLSEIARAHTNDREGDVLRVLGKGGHTRMVPLNDELLDVLVRLEALQGPGYYFPGRWGGYMHPQSVNKIITRVTGWNPHSMRHAAATVAYEGTHDLRAVQELLGHSSLATTERYLHVRVDQVRAAANATRLGLPMGTTTAIEMAGMSGRGGRA